MTVEEAVDEYATQLGDSPDVRQALASILGYAADVDPDQDAEEDDELPPEVADAYRLLAVVRMPTAETIPSSAAAGTRTRPYRGDHRRGRRRPPR